MLSVMAAGRPFLFLCIVILALFSYNENVYVNAYSVTLDASSNMECYYHEAVVNQPCSGTFEVITGDTHALVVSVVGPPPKNFLHFESKYMDGVDSERDLTEGSFEFVAEMAGRYKMCFTKTEDAKEDITIAFNFRLQPVDGNQDYEYAGQLCIQ
jgi:hypothetical protein